MAILGPDMGGLIPDQYPHFGADLGGFGLSVITNGAPRSDMAGIFPNNVARDGLQMIITTMSAILNWVFAAYGNGIVCTIQGSGSSVGQRSLDKGRTWLATTMPSSIGTSGWKRICFGNGFFLAAPGNNSQTTSVASSLNALDWIVSFISGVPIFPYAMSYGNGIFVILGNSSSNAFRTIGGCSYSDMTGLQANAWTASTLPAASSWRDVCYGINDTWVGVANGTAVPAISTDNARTWHSGPAIPNASTGLFRIQYANGIWAAPILTSNIVMTSTDPQEGIWTAHTLPISSSWFDCVFIDGIWIISDEAGNYTYSADNCLSWSPAFQFSGTVNSLCNAEGVLVTVTLGVTANQGLFQ